MKNAVNILKAIAHGVRILILSYPDEGKQLSVYRIVLADAPAV